MNGSGAPQEAELAVDAEVAGDAARADSERATRDERGWMPLDEAYAAYLNARPSPPGGSLLAQTILTGMTRRSLLPLLDLRDGADLVDLGTGFGPMVLEAAHLEGVRGVGIDLDEAVLEVATEIARSLAGWLHPDASVRFEQASVTELPFADASFDLATARLLFQHLPDVRGAVAELARVLRSGGSVLIFDVDDGLGLTYPPASPELTTLERAFAACQSDRGGDREIGRKLTTFLVEGGFRIRSVQLLASAQHQASEIGDASRVVNAARLRGVRDEVLRRGLLEADEFDRCLASYEREPAIERFRSESQLVVVAEKP